MCEAKTAFLHVHHFIFNYAEFRLFFLLASLSVLEDPSAIPQGQPLPLLARIIGNHHHLTVIPFSRLLIHAANSTRS